MYKILKNLVEVDDYALQKIGSSQGGRLPKEYQEVNYIESTGTQYIDLGIVLNADSGFYIDFVPENKPASSNAPNYINAGGTGGSSDYRVGINVYSTLPSSVSGEVQFFSFKKDPKITKDARNRLSIINKVLTYNDGTSENISTWSSIEASNSLILFAAHNNTVDRFSTMKLYNFKVYDKEEVIMDLVPCYRKAGNEVGLYDIVNKTFYINEGTGSFIYE